MSSKPIKLFSKLNEDDLNLFSKLQRHAGEAPHIGGVFIESRIGKGGMGTVFKGYHKRLEIPVAVKVWNLDEESKYTDLITEARLAAKLNHAHVVRVYDLDTIENLVFIVQEF